MFSTSSSADTDSAAKNIDIIRVETIIMDKMYEMPSKNEKELTVTIEYAQSKIEKANINRLKIA